MKRATWSSKVGFIFAAAGSAVGLANIWRFPYLVGYHGGAAFVVLYLLCLVLIGFPVFIAEVLIGSKTHRSPAAAFQELGKSAFWGFLGKITILTGFFVSAFYSAIAAWILGYLVEAIKGNVSNISDAAEIAKHHASLMGSWGWGAGYHFLFMFLCAYVLLSGVRGGIERANKYIMPLLYAVLLVLVFRGLSLPHSWEGITFLFKPDWSEITPLAFLMALGQSFFTLSIGQGTMVTYGSYLPDRENLVSTCVPVVVMDTLASLLSAIAVFAIVFSVGLEPATAGEGLIFQTLPLVFSKLPGGHFIAILFFLLVFLAALTSQISALEPSIAFLVDRFHIQRYRAVLGCSLGAFLLGIPCALSTSLLKNATLFGMNPLELMLFVASSILIPCGGFFAVVLVGWKWGVKNAIPALGLSKAKTGGHATRLVENVTYRYFWFCFKYSAPALITLVFLNALGILG